MSPPATTGFRASVARKRKILGNSRSDQLGSGKGFVTEPNRLENRLSLARLGCDVMRLVDGWRLSID